ncbi:hypothetical protein [Nodosilinea sp. P-1105]|nr:hypothetical protein [Nodosilinea sp. P-1105]
MKAVIDVNIWISGLLWGGPPNEVIQLNGMSALEVIGNINTHAKPRSQGS